MGLSPLRDGEPWLEVDGNLAADLREKRRLLAAQHDDFFAALPASLPAQRETLDRLASYLVERHPRIYERQGSRIRVAPLDETYDLDDLALAPLDVAGRLVQEDLCLMEQHDGAWLLTAGSVCFPTRWRLNDKLGHSVDDIHGPVPGYQAALSHSVNRLFDRLRPDRIVCRLNWSLTTDGALSLWHKKHGGTHVDADVTAANAGDRVWLRVERQTLLRLPQSGAVLFTIRIHRDRLRTLAGQPGAVASLLGALDSMPADLQEYKAIPVLGTAVRGYLTALP